jgi:transposase
MALEAAIKFCDPIRVPASDPLFAERDPAVRARLTPAVSFPCQPAGPAPGGVVSSLPAALLEARREAAFYKSMHRRSADRVKELQLQLSQAETRCRDKAAARMAELEQQLAAAKARIRQLEQHCFGRSSESSTSIDKAPAMSDSPPGPTRRRGQQRGKPGPPRRDHSALPQVEETLDLPEAQRRCSSCGLAFASFPGTEDSEILEIEVKAHRRIIHRRRYRPACSCGKHQGIVCAAPAERVIPKTTLGVSIWVEVLLDKYLSHRPTNRLLEQWRTVRLDLPSGTVIGGMKKLGRLFAPVYQGLIEHLRKQKHWHGDETRWLVFAKSEGKTGHRWMLWVLHSASVAVYLLDPTRAHDVPQTALGPEAQGILSVDRYSAYKALQQVKEGKIVLAFCWAHVRRDFLEVARSRSEQEQWGLGWVRRIGLLYKHNQERVEALETPDEFSVKDERVRQLIKEMAQQRDLELSDKRIPEAREKVLLSLKEHWSGLTVFVDHPEVPLDNNQAERDLRGPVVGRKNYYGSGAKWSGDLAAMLFSVLETLELGNINPRLWLTAYLHECAKGCGNPPPDIKPWLPWNMSEQRKQEWALANKSEDSS